MTSANEQLKEAVLRNFFTKDGKLKHLPAQYKKKLIVLERLVSGLEPGKTYAEAEVNDYIQRFHPDFATIRREFIMHQYMFRERERYEVNPREMWTRWEDVR
ncbi:transcriptional regulator [Gordoniibacillus kamchatkensis]|uniref:Transcriptional regulator n=1 Tax=Gordoniibacillus kamchatkensis TaxID=1590651 RepID=A0ABR5AFU0_9BACL|nr:transcriptional regulator [Paenibacillus sp. VKM B-2647]